MLFILISSITDASQEKFVVPENLHSPPTEKMFCLTPTPPHYTEIPINLPPSFLTMTFSCDGCEYFLELQKLIKTKFST